MNVRLTPETDQFKVKLKTTCGEKYWVPVEHSERLERERDEAREALSEIALYLSVGMGDETTTAQQYKQRILEGIKMLSEPIVNLWKQAEKERDEARKELEEYRSIAEKIGAKKAVSEKEKAIRERDEAREEAEKWRKLHDAKDELFKKGIAEVERERDEARESLEHIHEYGTEEINAAVELRSKLAQALIERDEAREALLKIEGIYIYGRDTYEDWKAVGTIAHEALKDIK